MIFNATHLEGAYIIDIEPRADERGFFARAWCQREMAEHGLVTHLAQANLSYNTLRGTLRGMHYQAMPYAEVKLVRCVRGAVCDVIIDLRPESATFKQWLAVELTAENRRMFYIPEGFAHGYLTLTDDTEVLYQVSEFYVPEAGRGVRWNDPAFGIQWPIPVTVIAARDQQYSDFDQ